MNFGASTQFSRGRLADRAHVYSFQRAGSERHNHARHIAGVCKQQFNQRVHCLHGLEQYLDQVDH